MNQAETAYALVLEARRREFDIVWYGFESDKIRLADGTWYTPDFTVIRFQCVTGPCIIEYHEVKGHMRTAERVRLRVAASLRPWARFVLVWMKYDKRNRMWFVDNSEDVPCQPLQAFPTQRPEP